MKNRKFMNEVLQFKKIAGLLKEDDNFDLTYNPLNRRRNQLKNIQIDDSVYCGFEGKPMEFGTVIDIANNWDEALKEGGDNFEEWEGLFNDEEYAKDMGYDSLEEWQNYFVSRQKNGVWYKVDIEKWGRHSEEWFPEEYVDKN